VRDFAGARSVAGRTATAFEHSPQLALLSTTRDRPEDWLRAGQAMEHVLLANLEGLSSSFVTQALEWPDLRRPLRDPMSGTAHVQMVLRLGYGPKSPVTPRRPVSLVGRATVTVSTPRLCQLHSRTKGDGEDGTAPGRGC
jgi:hypothetical protein